MIDITCESIKEKILLCEQLTDAEKEHIAQCEECRALALQTEKMLSELSEMSVPGIEDGVIAERVMKEVRKTKSASFPKFKISNHIGTAAALVIVVALFVSGRFTDTKVSLDMANNTESDAVTSPEINAQFHAYTTGADNSDAISDEVSDEPAQTEEKRIKMTAFSGGRTISDEEAEFETPNAVDSGSEYDSANGIMMFAVKPKDAQNSVSYDTDTDGLYEETQDYAVNNSISAAAGGSSVNGNTQAMSEEEIFEESVSVESAEEAELVSIFGKADFAPENTLEENVEIANAYVLTVFENANTLKAETLTDAGVSNEMFLEWLTTVANVGEYSFDSLYLYIQDNN